MKLSAHSLAYDGWGVEFVGLYFSLKFKTLAWDYSKESIGGGKVMN